MVFNVNAAFEIGYTGSYVVIGLLIQWLVIVNSLAPRHSISVFLRNTACYTWLVY